MYYVITCVTEKCFPIGRLQKCLKHVADKIDLFEQDFFRQADVSRDCLKLYCCTFIFFVNPLFSQNRTAEYARQMYTRGSVVGKARIIDPEISLTPPLIFTGSQKVRNLASFSTSLNFERPAFENAARYLKSETNLVSTDDSRMSLQVW